MEEQNNDLKLLMKRLTITLVLFLMVLVYQFRYKGEFPNPFKSIPTQIRESIHDTVYVRANDGNMSKIILTYNIIIEREKMDKLHKYAFDNHKTDFIKSLVIYNIRNELKTQVVKNIAFTDVEVIVKFRRLVDTVIKENMNYPPETGIVMESSEYNISHDEKVLEKMIYSATKVIEDLAKKENKKKSK